MADDEVPPISPILDAMRKLDPQGGRAGGQPSLVRQLYALALLRREDARRRLQSGGGAAEDLLLSQRPPSSLALAAPPEGSKASFRASVSAGGPRRSHLSSRASSRTGGSRRFGAISNFGSGVGTAGGGQEVASRAIAAARQPSLLTTAVGAPGTGAWRERAQSAHATVPSLIGHYGGDFGGSLGDRRAPPGVAGMAATSGGRCGFGGAGVSGCGSGYGSASASGSATTGGGVPLSARHLEGILPTRMSTIPAQREAERRRLESEMVDAAREAREASPLPKGKLPVRALLDMGADAGADLGATAAAHGARRRCATRTGTRRTTHTTTSRTITTNTTTRRTRLRRCARAPTRHPPRCSAAPPPPPSPSGRRGRAPPSLCPTLGRSRARSTRTRRRRRT